MANPRRRRARKLLRLQKNKPTATAPVVEEPAVPAPTPVEEVEEKPAPKRATRTTKAKKATKTVKTDD